MRADRRSRLALTIAGASVTTLGVVVLVGWHIDSAAIVTIRRSFASMKYNAALAFVASGLALVLSGFGRVRASRAFAVLPTTIGLLTLVEYGFGVSLGIDQLLWKDDLAIATSSPGRMAPNTAICFVLVGALIGREVRAVGFDMNYAPVLDVDTNPANPIIAARSFGRTPELASA